VVSEGMTESRDGQAKSREGARVRVLPKIRPAIAANFSSFDDRGAQCPGLRSVVRKERGQDRRPQNAVGCATPPGRGVTALAGGNANAVGSATLSARARG